MCGIVGFVDRLGRKERPSGQVVLAMLQALACRGPDGAGLALLHDPPDPGLEGVWGFRVAPADAARSLAHPYLREPIATSEVWGEDTPKALERLESLGKVLGASEQSDTIRFAIQPRPGLSVDELEQTLGAQRGGLEVLCLGERIDLVKQVGSPSALEASFGVSSWKGPIAIGHTRMSTESRIDLSHSQPFWVHGLPDVAIVHNGHITNDHQLRRRYEQDGRTFYTDNDSEVIGVYLRDRIERGRTLAQAMADSLADLDGSFNYLVLSPEGLGVARDRFGFKPLMLAETEEYVALATEEIALRQALPGSYRVFEPPPGRVSLYSLPSPALV